MIKFMSVHTYMSAVVVCTYIEENCSTLALAAFVN